MPGVWWFLALLLVALALNEHTIHLALALIVGQRSLAVAWLDAFGNFSLDGYLFFTAFRLFPYALLVLAVLRLARTQWRPAALPALIGGGLGIAVSLAWGTWITLRPYYTTEHLSSTTALTFLILPVLCVPAGACGALGGYGIQTLLRFWTRR